MNGRAGSAHQLQQQLVFAKAGVPSGKTPVKPKPRSSRRPLGDARQTPKVETPAPEAPTSPTEAPPSPTDMQPTYGDAVQQAQELAETETALQEVRQEHEASALSHQLEVDNLLDALEKKDRELREQDVRIETLLAFVPDKDVAMVFDGADKPPTVHDLGDGRMLIGSYHCSRYNTNTGRLTEAMFHDVFRQVRALL